MAFARMTRFSETGKTEKLFEAKMTRRWSMTENLELILITMEGWAETNRVARTSELVAFMKFAAKLIQE